MTPAGACGKLAAVSPGRDNNRLSELERAFDAGDYRSVQRVGPALAREASNFEVRASAEALIARTRPDPAMKWLFLLALGVLVAVSAYWFSHQPR